MSQSANALREYLRARREEVAMLAGISAGPYLRLERGVHHPDARSDDANKLALLASAALPASDPERVTRTRA